MARFLANTTLIFIAYCLAGRLGQLFAVPPNYATAIWPASGVALAALLLVGGRASTGVFLGALVVNGWSDFMQAENQEAATIAVLLSACVSLGVTLQAVAGKVLIERYVGFPGPLVREGEILGFLAVGGPVACLVGSIWGVLTLVGFDQIEASGMPLNWWTWWIGDAVGVIIFTPLVLVFLGRPRYVWRPRRLTVALPMCVAFAVATIGYVYTQLGENAQVRLRFEGRVDSVFHNIHEQIGGHLDAVHSLESYYVGSEKVDREEFGIFNQHVLSRHAGAQALEWLPRVRHEDRADYEAQARAEGLADFAFRERNDQGEMVVASVRDEYFPVFYVEPRASNEAAQGFDVASNSARRAALKLAGDLGQQVATVPVRLVQEEADQAGVLVFEPVYSQDLPTSTVAERRLALQGYVLGVFRVGDIIQSSMRDGPHLDYALHVEDVGVDADDREIYSVNEDPSLVSQERGGASMFAEKLVWSTTMDVAGRTWRFQFRPTDAFYAAQSYRHTWLILAAGLSFTGLLGAFLLVLAGRTMRVEELVTDRTRALSRTNEELGMEIDHRKQVQDAFCLAHENLERRVQERTAALKESEMRYLDLYNNAPDMFVSVDLATQRVTECNDTFLNVTGFYKSEVIDKHVYDLYHPDCMDQTRRSFGQFMATGQTQDLELLLLKANGDVIDVSLNVSAVRDEEGKLLHSRAVLRDITAKKRAEARIKSQEAELAHVSRLSTMGELATGLAHEINQPLAAIAAYAEGAAMRIRGNKVDKERLAEVVDRISADAYRAGEIVRRLRRFVHKRVPERLPLNLNELVTDVVHFVAADAERRGVTIGFDLDDDLPMMTGDSIEIQQVLLNLIRNGCDAMEEMQSADRELIIRTQCGEEGTIEVEVKDQGHGFSDEAEDHLFEAFFTSKEDGLGMGLTISRSIIESHGGRIWASANADGGATFHFSLPVAEGVLIDE